MSCDHSSLSRRGFCLCTVSATFAAAGIWLTPRQAFAKAQTLVDQMRAEAATAPIKVHTLRGGISVLEGSGGNIGVLTGPDGKVLIDAGITASRPRITEALASLDQRPLTHLINTHWHFDHADGNEWVHSEGASILAHDNTLRHLRSAQRVEDWNFDFPPSPAGALPTETFAEDKTLKLNNTTLQLTHHDGAHTDGDISVAFAEPDVIHTGDIYWNGIYPFIDYSTGGSIDGTIKGVDAILAAAGPQTIIVPGHGHPVSNRSELKDYRDMLVGIREGVAALKVEGKTIDQIVAAKPTQRFDAKWGQFVIGPDFFTRIVYQGV
jgi:glyoxylase-like metal-dependent hydrolase (beta-lactamase superfamily II)